MTLMKSEIIQNQRFLYFSALTEQIPGLEAVVNGKLAGTVYNDKEGQADAIVRLAAALVTEEGMEK